MQSNGAARCAAPLLSNLVRCLSGLFGAEVFLGQQPHDDLVVERAVVESGLAHPALFTESCAVEGA